MDYLVIYYAVCTGCNSHQIYKKELDKEKIYSYHKFVDGCVVTNLDLFGIDEKPICKCSLTGYNSRIIKINSGVIIEKDIDIVEQIFKMNRQDFIKQAEKMRLRSLWRKELSHNSEYYCDICRKPFSQDLVLDDTKLKNICSRCSKK